MRWAGCALEPVILYELFEFTASELGAIILDYFSWDNMDSKLPLQLFYHSPTS